MESFQALLRRHVPEAGIDENHLPSSSSADDTQLIRHIIGKRSGEGVETPRLGDDDCRLFLRVAEQLFRDPTRPSREIAAELGINRERLVSLYRAIRNTRVVQNVLTFESPLRRRVSFLRKELLPENIATLYTMFSGGVCLPNHVEFHPALKCNLRCRACPNCRTNNNGDRDFLPYPVLGQPLAAEQLHMAINLFLQLGVRDFSFGGGGEPSLSELTTGGVAHLRGRSRDAEIALYTNGIFPAAWSEAEFLLLATCLNKIRFSIDAANAEEWSRYKGRPAELFETLWDNIRAIIQTKRTVASKVRVGASCLVSDLTCNDVGAFLIRARDAGLDFCDIKSVETCFGEKAEYSSKSLKIRKAVCEILANNRKGHYAPMDVVVDDNLRRKEGGEPALGYTPTRCWIAIRGRMLTVGPYGELYPCSDAANPGAEERRNYKTVGRLTDFSDAVALRGEFLATWSDSLPLRSSLSRQNCSYCVPSHNNYNAAIDKLYQDWLFGIMPDDQPFVGEIDHYLASRGA